MIVSKVSRILANNSENPATTPPPPPGGLHHQNLEHDALVGLAMKRLPDHLR